MDGDGIEALLDLDGAAFEMAPGLIVEITARRTDHTPERPHGLSYALILRPKEGGRPWLRFDNAHAIEQPGGYRRRRVMHDHWHRTERDRGRPYEFVSAARLLDDFWREVKRIFDEKGIPHDL
ncbi:MAG: DUF6516 family protein [Acetobacteraceae bacterium]